MNREDIIEMALDAGLLPCYEVYTEDLEAFAKLVAAAEREECAKMVEGLNDIGHSYGLEKQIRARGEE